MKNVSKFLITKLSILAINQIIGGVIGIILTIYVMTTAVTFSLLLITILIVIFGLYSYSILCGVLILKNPLTGLKYSLINQYLQILYFSISGYGFKYLSGLYTSLELDLGNLQNFQLQGGISTWDINFKNALEIKTVGINFIAVLLIIFIDRQINILKVKAIDNSINELGEN